MKPNGICRYYPASILLTASDALEGGATYHGAVLYRPELVTWRRGLRRTATLPDETVLAALSIGCDVAMAASARVRMALVDVSGALAGFIRQPGAFLISLEKERK